MFFLSSFFFLLSFSFLFGTYDSILQARKSFGDVMVDDVSDQIVDSLNWDLWHLPVHLKFNLLFDSKREKKKWGGRKIEERRNEILT